MGYRAKKDVLATIVSRVRKYGDGERTLYEAYLGSDPYSKKPRRIQASSVADVREQVERFYVEYRIGGDFAARLKPYEANDARAAIDILAESGIQMSLTEMVRTYIKTMGPAKGRQAVLQDAFHEFIGSQVGKTPVYVRCLESRIGAFMDEFGPERRVSEITAHDVTASIRRRILREEDQRTWKTYNNHLGDIKTFLNWCASPEQGYIQRSPLESVKKLSIAWRDPEYVRASDVGKLFRAIAAGRRADLADAVLSFFCGMRQAEIARVREGKGAVNIDVENAFVRVVKCKGSTKGIRPRAFTIPPQALAWMRAFDFAAAAATPNPNFRRHLVEYAESCGVKMPGNAGRHTFITMHAAAYHDPNLLTAIVGNSEDVRASSYDGIEVEKNGLEYFSITPESLGVSL